MNSQTLIATAQDVAKINIYLAHDLLHTAKTNDQGDKALAETEQLLLDRLHEQPARRAFLAGDLAIIPLGYRCWTHLKLKEAIGLDQPKFPFDSGYFPPISIASVLRAGDMTLGAYGTDYSICKSYGTEVVPNYGGCRLFARSSYDEIETGLATLPQHRNTIWLDEVDAYHVCSNRHHFVLAHMHWHPSAKQRADEPSLSHEDMNARVSLTLTRRMKRMFDTCARAKHVFFVNAEFDGFQHHIIDQTALPIHDTSPLGPATRDVFGGATSVLDFPRAASWENLSLCLQQERPDLFHQHSNGRVHRALSLS